jgi:hypothetical protein
MRALHASRHTGTAENTRALRAGSACNSAFTEGPLERSVERVSRWLGAWIDMVPHFVSRAAGEPIG